MRRMMCTFIAVLISLFSFQSCVISPQNDTAQETDVQQSGSGEETAEMNPVLILLSHHENDPDPETKDCNHNFSRPMSTMTVSADAYYFIDQTGSTSRLMYIDRKSGKCAPLCGKADCLHNSADCNACIMNAGTVYGLSWYNGKLYWIAEIVGKSGITDGYHVFSCNGDGTGRRDVRLISATNGMNTEIPGGNTYVCFHRGYVFICGDVGISAVVDAVPQRKLKVLAYSLEDPIKDRVLEDIDISETQRAVRMQAKGDRLYYLYYSFAENESGGLYSDQVTLKDYCISEDRKETLLDIENKEFSDFFPYGIWVNDYSMQIVTNEGTFYMVDFTENRLTPIEAFHELPRGLWCLSNNMMIHLGKITEVFNQDGRKVYEAVSMDVPGVRMTVYGADDSGLYYYALDENDRRFVSCYSYDAGKEVILWESGK